MARNSKIDQIANDWVETLTKLSPSFATYIGAKGGEDKLDDFSPGAHERYNQEAKKVLASLESSEVTDETDEVTLDALSSDQNFP